LKQFKLLEFGAWHLTDVLLQWQVRMFCACSLCCFAYVLLCTLLHTVFIMNHFHIQLQKT